MTYNPKVKSCPLCDAQISPLASLCRGCYRNAAQHNCNRTNRIEKWIEIQRALKGAMAVAEIDSPYLITPQVESAHPIEAGEDFWVGGEWWPLSIKATEGER